MENYFNKEYIERIGLMSKEERKEELQKILTHDYFEYEYPDTIDKIVLDKLDRGEEPTDEEMKALEEQDLDEEMSIWEAHMDEVNKMYEGSYEVLLHYKGEVGELVKLPYTEEDIRGYADLPLKERLQALMDFIDNQNHLELCDDEDQIKINLIKELYQAEFMAIQRNLGVSYDEDGEAVFDEDVDYSNDDVVDLAYEDLSNG